MNGKERSAVVTFELEAYPEPKAVPKDIIRTNGCLWRNGEGGKTYFELAKPLCGSLIFGFGTPSFA